MVALFSFNIILCFRYVCGIFCIVVFCLLFFLIQNVFDICFFYIKLKCQKILFVIFYSCQYFFISLWILCVLFSLLDVFMFRKFDGMGRRVEVQEGKDRYLLFVVCFFIMLFQKLYYIGQEDVRSLVAFFFEVGYYIVGKVKFMVFFSLGKFGGYKIKIKFY